MFGLLPGSNNCAGLPAYITRRLQMGSSKSKKEAVTQAKAGSKSKTPSQKPNSQPKEGVADGLFTKMGDNYYKVDMQAIVIEALDLEDSDNLRFVNPRSLDADADDIVGFSTAEMEELQESIRSKGLLTPLMGRFKDVVDEQGNKSQKVSIINGHRRFTAISQLIQANLPCYDPVSKETVNASSLYREIPFKVFDASDDFECYILAFEEDRTKIKFGSGTEARFVQHCRSRMIDDAKIIKMTGNSPEWLQGTYNLIDSLVGDEITLNNFFSGQIDRGLAKYLTTIADTEERHSLMNDAIQNAQERYRTKVSRIDASIESKKDKIEALSASKACDEFAGNLAEVDVKQAKIEELEGEIVQSKQKRNSAGSRAGKSDLKKAITSKAADETVETVGLTNRISVRWPEFFKKINKNGGAIPDNEEIIVPEVLTSYSIALLNAAEDTKSNQAEFISKWLKKFQTSGLQND